MLEVRLSIHVRDVDLPALNQAEWQRVRKKMAELGIQPDRHPMLRDELAGYRSVRCGQIRIVLVVDDEHCTVTIVAVGRRRAGNRRDVYAEFSRRLERERL